MRSRAEGWIHVLVMSVIASSLGLAREAAAVERRGFTAGISGGAGRMACDSCDPGAYAGAFHMGWTPRGRVAVVLDFTSLSHVYSEGSSLSASYGLVGARAFIGTRAWVEAGLGGGSTAFEAGRMTVTSEGGWGYGAAAGIELWQRKKSALDLSARFGTFDDGSGGRVQNLSVHVGWAWY
jgi:hypothetical protein